MFRLIVVNDLERRPRGHLSHLMREQESNLRPLAYSARLCH